MTSLQTHMKQSKGYFLTVSTGVVGYTYSAPSGAGGSWVPGVMTPLAAGVSVTALALAGTVLRDMGKSVFVGGLVTGPGAETVAGTTGVPTRVFRKVQLLNAAGSNTLAGNAPNGVTGASADATIANAYNTFYIELPTLGRGGGASNVVGGLFTYVPNLPGLYV